MSEHPIIFSTEMVRAILEGRKTQTRRIVKVKSRIPGDSIHDWAKSAHQDGKGNWVFWSCDSKDLPAFTKKAYPNGEGIKCPYGKPGDHLWVRETWSPVGENENHISFHYKYKADAEKSIGMYGCIKWHSPILMPRKASRITFEIVNVRVEQLQQITDDDAIAEGVDFLTEIGTLKTVGMAWEKPRDRFKRGWNKLNAKRGFDWEKNMWVWVIEFERLDQ